MLDFHELLRIWCRYRNKEKIFHVCGRLYNCCPPFLHHLYDHRFHPWPGGLQRPLEEEHRPPRGGPYDVVIRAMGPGEYTTWQEVLTDLIVQFYFLLFLSLIMLCPK